jgi:hypothetical protein
VAFDGPTAVLAAVFAAGSGDGPAVFVVEDAQAVPEVAPSASVTAAARTARVRDPTL